MYQLVYEQAKCVNGLHSDLLILLLCAVLFLCVLDCTVPEAALTTTHQLETNKQQDKSVILTCGRFY